jgi:hypothetical protein
VEELLLALLQFVGELLLQVFAETLFEIGLRSLVAPFKKEANPYLASIGYLLLGAAVGGLSLYVFPKLFITSPAGRIVSAVVIPVLAGASMSFLGAWRKRRGQRVILIDRFAYGYLFALAMALVRIRFGG